MLFRSVVRAGKIKAAYPLGSLLLIIALCIPRVGTEASTWMNGLYDIAIISLLFPFIVYMGISGTIKSQAGTKLCKFLGDISYPLYIVHYPFIYLYIAWVKNNNLPFSQSWPGALGVLFGSMLLAYVSMRAYDLPVRKYLMSLLKTKAKKESLKTVA